MYPEPFPVSEDRPELLLLQQEAWTVGEVAEHASELHRGLWHYLKAMQILGERYDQESVQTIQEARPFIAQELADLQRAIQRLQVDEIGQVR